MNELTNQEILERRHGPDVVAQQAKIQSHNFALAQQQNSSNIMEQFHAALGRMGSIAARAYTGSSGQNWMHYCHEYDKLLRLAETAAALGETVQIPARLPEQGATPMVTISPRKAG
jgi:hypothetical protein